MANGDPTKPPNPAAATGGGITDADIDALLAEMNAPVGGVANPAPAAPPTTGPGSEPPADQSIDALLAAATFEDAPDAARPAAGAAPTASFGGSPLNAIPLNLPDLQRAMGDAQASSIDLLRDVELNVKIELGRSRMLVEDVLKLAEGSVVELDKLAGDPVDVFVNDRLVARGEVLVLNDSFCVRVNEIVQGAAAELG